LLRNIRFQCAQKCAQNVPIFPSPAPKILRLRQLSRSVCTPLFDAREAHPLALTIRKFAAKPR
jgi:hypothetical protein